MTAFPISYAIILVGGAIALAGAAAALSWKFIIGLGLLVVAVGAANLVFGFIH